MKSRKTFLRSLLLGALLVTIPVGTIAASKEDVGEKMRTAASLLDDLRDNPEAVRDYFLGIYDSFVSSFKSHSGIGVSVVISQFGDDEKMESYEFKKSMTVENSTVRVYEKKEKEIVTTALAFNKSGLFFRLVSSKPLPDKQIEAVASALLKATH